MGTTSCTCGSVGQAPVAQATAGGPPPAATSTTGAGTGSASAGPPSVPTSGTAHGGASGGGAVETTGSDTASKLPVGDVAQGKGGIATSSTGFLPPLPSVGSPGWAWGKPAPGQGGPALPPPSSSSTAPPAPPTGTLPPSFPEHWYPGPPTGGLPPGTPPTRWPAHPPTSFPELPPTTPPTGGPVHPPKPDPVVVAPRPEPRPDPGPVVVKPDPDPVIVAPKPNPDPVVIAPKPDPDPVVIAPKPDPVVIKPQPGVGASDTYDVRKSGTSGQGGGQTDERGYLFLSNGPNVEVRSPDGIVTVRVPMDPPAWDVAPSPDGSFMYVVQNVGGKLLPRKWNREADGSYKLDSTFRLEQFEFGGKLQDAEGLRIATDGFGALYVADGTWSSNLLQTVVKYDKDGKFVTRFGQYVDGNPGDASSWEKGKFYWALGGIAVSRDGSKVYTTEIGNNRVQRFDLAADGSYAYGTSWGATQATDPQRQGSSKPGEFAAPYDVGVDPWGDVYVMNTTVGQIQKFDADGNYKTGAFMGSKGPDEIGPERGHGLAVDVHGNAISVETGKELHRIGAEPGKVPALVAPVVAAPKPKDSLAPKLTGITVPAKTTSSTISIGIDASDDTAVAEVRVANEDGTWGPWQPSAPTIQHALTPGLGTKGVIVQVRDAAGNESDPSKYTTLDVVAADPAA